MARKLHSSKAFVRFGAALASFMVAAIGASSAFACNVPVSVCARAAPNSFPLIVQHRPASLLVEAGANPAIIHAANGFAHDVEAVSGRAPVRINAIAQIRGPVVIVGQWGQSQIIADLARRGKISAADLAGSWEAYRQIVVNRPFPNVASALVIIGSDRRGAVFGLYDISQKIGVSPWHYFADVPISRRANVYITPGNVRDQPKVKYRGIFINDEAPAFSGWANEKFGGANSAMYEHVFDLILRLKGNYLWPAMWPPRAFNDDDPNNMLLADEMGIVMGASHHEPMSRAHDEWHRHTDADPSRGGAWNFATNGENLRRFWRGGIERMMGCNGHPCDTIVTVGMRGDGDEAMSEGTAIPLLEAIVAAQRVIIATVTGRPASETPQIWALYKEVQDYYDHGMKVPDDVTLLFADDNWGQIRRLPDVGASPRAGGYGVYYHFDYVGAPRNYKWLNTNQIEKSWQQMDLAYRRGANQLWIVNVGDIKPMEFPSSFFMAQAWNPEAMTPAGLAAYPAQWASATFGTQNSAAIASLLNRYSQYAARRKPELIDPGTFLLGGMNDEILDGGEFGDLLADWQNLERDMMAVKSNLSADQLPAFYQLVEYPIAAMSNLYGLYYNVAWNRRLADVGDDRANIFAARAEAAYARDSALTASYHGLLGGKWNHMMSQIHMGYTNWQQPDEQKMPEVRRVRPDFPNQAQHRPVRFGAIPTQPSAGDVIAIEAGRFQRAHNGAGLRWVHIPNLGRTLGAVMTLPQGRPATNNDENVRLEYDVNLAHGGPLRVDLTLVPTLDVGGQAANHIGVSIDNGPMLVITDRMIPAPTSTTMDEQRNWNRAVMDNARMVGADLGPVAAGRHTIKIWRLDDNMPIQRLTISNVPVPPSYLGPR